MQSVMCYMWLMTCYVQALLSLGNRGPRALLVIFCRTSHAKPGDSKQAWWPLGVSKPSFFHYKPSQAGLAWLGLACFWVIPSRLDDPYIYWTWKVQSNGAEKQANLIISLRQKRFFSVHILAPRSNHTKSETWLPNSLTLVQGVPKS